MRTLDMQDTSVFLFGFFILSGACSGDDGPGAGAGAPGTITGTVTDAATGDPIAEALVTIEQGGIYIDNPDTSVGNPSYQFGAMTDADGTFAAVLPGGDCGVHVFADGYRYAPRRGRVDGDATISIEAEPELAADQSPTVTDPLADPQTVAPGGSVVLSANVAAATADDPLSEEVIAILPETSWSRALDPPSPGIQGESFPDGTWSRTITAPDAPGTYTYFLVVSTEGCVTSDKVPIVVTVQ